jgi:DNA-binding transcriptional ArsR family regulator
VLVPSITSDRAQQLADVLKALGHPVRLQLVALLSAGDERVGDLAAALDLRPAMVSQQLRILRMTGLVEVTKDGGVSRYTLAEPHLVDLLGCLSGCKR